VASHPFSFKTVEAARAAMLLGRVRIDCPVCGVRHGIAFTSSGPHGYTVDCALQVKDCSERYVDYILEKTKDMFGFLNLRDGMVQLRIVVDRVFQSYPDPCIDTAARCSRLSLELVDAIKLLDVTSSLLSSMKFEYASLTSTESNAVSRLRPGSYGQTLHALWCSEPLYSLAYDMPDAYALMAVSEDEAVRYVAVRFAQCFDRAEFERLPDTVARLFETIWSDFFASLAYSIDALKVVE